MTYNLAQESIGNPLTLEFIGNRIQLLEHNIGDRGRAISYAIMGIMQELNDPKYKKNDIGQKFSTIFNKTVAKELGLKFSDNTKEQLEQLDTYMKNKSGGESELYRGFVYQKNQLVQKIESK